MGLGRIATSAAVLSVVAVSAGCSVSVSGDDVVKKLEPVLVQRGADKGSMKCPDDLDGKVGATTKCSASLAGKPVSFTVKVTQVDGSKVNFEVASVDQPK